MVVDDEDLPRERIRGLVAGHSALELAGEAGDGGSALDLIASTRPGLVLLDIRMPELDGFEVVAALPEDVNPDVIFITAWDEFAVKAFEVGAVDYLLKPVAPPRFDEAIARVLVRRGTERPDAPARTVAETLSANLPLARFVARKANRHYFVRVDQVSWIEADGNYLRLQTAEGSHLVRGTLTSVVPRLDPTAFIRIHRSTVVALDQVASVESNGEGEYEVTMVGGKRLMASRTWAPALRALLRG